MTRVAPVVAQGKRLLMEAAVRLMAHSRSLSSLGLRELAREAGVNPNTFYRHFQSIDELGLAIIRHIALQLRQPLRDLRRQAAAGASEQPAGPLIMGIDLNRSRLVCSKTVGLFFDFVERNPHAFLVGVRELHGASPVLRQALMEIMAEFAEDMAQDILELQLLPANLGDAQVRQISQMVSHGLFQQALDYLGQPQQQAAIRHLATEQILMQFTGAAVLQAAGQLQLPGEL